MTSDHILEGLFNVNEYSRKIYSLVKAMGKAGVEVLSQTEIG